MMRGSHVNGIHPKMAMRRMNRNRKLTNTPNDAIFNDRCLRALLIKGAANPGKEVTRKKMARNASRPFFKPAEMAVG